MLQPIFSQFRLSISLLRIPKFLQPEEWSVTQWTLFGTKPLLTTPAGWMHCAPIGFAHWIGTLACVHWDRNIKKIKSQGEKAMLYLIHEEQDPLQFLYLKVRYKICSQMQENCEGNQVFTAKWKFCAMLHLFSEDTEGRLKVDTTINKSKCKLFIFYLH